MKQIKLLDAAFPRTLSMSAKGENINLKPKYFEWYRGDDHHSVCFLTDSCLRMPAPSKVAWLLEPAPFRQSNYDYVFNNLSEFNYVLTYDLRYVNNNNILYYPYGGCMIHPSRWGIYPKFELVGMIVSPKSVTTGHKLRHQIADKLSIPILGSGYGNYIGKFDGTSIYYYSIVVCGENVPGCFDEKLIDCFALGTVPIYWGSNVGKYFDNEGILYFNTIPELIEILTHINPTDYYNRLSAIKKNMETAKQYICVEDWLFENYPFLFEEPLGVTKS